MTDPAEKYRNDVAPEHKGAMTAIAIARMALGPHREHFKRLLESERQMHSVGHILDPTLYRDMIHSKSFEQQLRVVQAAVTFLSEIELATEISDERA